MTSIQPIEMYSHVEQKETSGYTIFTIFLMLFTLHYIMYDYFERKLKFVKLHLDEIDSRFLITEEKLGTLQDLEEDLTGLKEDSEDRKNSWEDDIVEPNKYQAILGTGLVKGTQVEFQFLREKLDTFKSNRYWLLNDISSNRAVIRHILQHHYQLASPEYFGKRVETETEIYFRQYPTLVGLDEMLKNSVKILKRSDSPLPTLHEILQEVNLQEKGSFKWKRALIPVETSSEL